jgi:hypothetical protein
MKNWFGLTAGALLLLAACDGSDNEKSACESACQKMVSCGEQTSSEVTACVNDCKTEPWPENYIRCRTTTCGKSEAECETF